MTVVRRFVTDRWRTDCWWALGIIVMVVLNLAFFPGIKGTADLDQTVANLPPALKAMFGIEEGISIGSAAGYLQAQVFSSVAPIILLVLAIALGSGALGGAEEDGATEFLLSYPIKRTNLVIDRFVAMMGVLVLHTLILLAAVFVFCPMFGALDGVDLPGLVAACIGCGALAMLHASIAFTAGAWFGRRTPATAIASAIAAGGYVLLGLFSAIDAPEPVRYLTPWYWFLKTNLLISGADWMAFVPALALSVLIGAAAIPIFANRDIRGK
ncbi:MAG: ABC transporter permease subunit [bacterium]